MLLEFSKASNSFLLFRDKYSKIWVIPIKRAKFAKYTKTQGARKADTHSACGGLIWAVSRLSSFNINPDGQMNRRPGSNGLAGLRDAQTSFFDSPPPFADSRPAASSNRPILPRQRVFSRCAQTDEEGGLQLVTLKDIARLTGVSVSTVSNVLNGKLGSASPAKTEEILAAVDKLHYQPNILARNLKLKGSNSLGIITEDLTVFNTPEIVNGIDEYCEEQGYEIILANLRLYKRFGNDFAETPEHAALFERALNNLLAKQVVGIVYIGYHSRQVVHKPTHSKVPFVYAYCYPPDRSGFSYVLTDDEKAGYDVGIYLLERGHRKIGVISGPIAGLTALNRLSGFQRALYEHGVLYNTATTMFGDWTRASGYRCATQLLERDITALFAFNDEMAGGAYACCVKQGLQVGRDISIVGFDNLSLVEAYDPAIASVAPPLNEIGRKSAELVLSQIQSNSSPQPRVLLPAAVCPRDSVADLREIPAQI